MSDPKSIWLIPLILVLGLAAGLVYLSQKPQAPPMISEPVEPQPPPDEVKSPHHPLPSPAEPEEESPPLPPLPLLQDSDPLFTQSLVDLFGVDIETLLVDSALIEKIVTTIDNLPRSHVAEKIRPLQRISGLFVVEVREDGDVYSIGPGNYGRYDLLVNLITSTDTDNMISTYQRFYPLLQEAYVNLGYPDAYFNNRVVEVIDHLLETPQIDDAILLVRPHVLYEYADPELEALSSGQKLLLRVGTANAARVRIVLSTLRAQIAVID